MTDSPRFYNDTDRAQCPAVDDSGLNCAGPEGHEHTHANANGAWWTAEESACTVADSPAALPFARKEQPWPTRSPNQST